MVTVLRVVMSTLVTSKKCDCRTPAMAPVVIISFSSVVISTKTLSRENV